MPRPRSPPRAGSAPSTTGTTTPSMPRRSPDRRRRFRDHSCAGRLVSRPAAQPGLAGLTVTARSVPAPVFSTRHVTSAGGGPAPPAPAPRARPGARDARLHRAEEESGLALLDDPDVRRGGDRSGAPLPRSHLDQHDIDVRAVLGSREQPAVAL